MSSPSYTNSTKSEAFRRSFGMKKILDFWLPANVAHIIQDVRPLLKVGVIQVAKYFSEECRRYTRMTLEYLSSSKVDSSVQIMHSHCAGVQ
jgi:hypothetical protein